MPDKKKKNLHDEQTSASAESLRAAVKDVRGGMTQRDTEILLEKIENIAKGLDEQGKTPDELEEIREERGEPDPEKTQAELVKETLEADKKADEEKKAADKKAADEAAKNEAGKNEKNDPNANRLGIPEVTSQPTTAKRDAVEKTAHKATDDIKAISKK